jgi:hypothetical protein
MKSTKKELQVYHTPQVTDYGNIKQITMSAGSRGGPDGGHVLGMKRTHTH